MLQAELQHRQLRKLRYSLMLDIIHFTGLTVLLNDKYKNQTSMHPESASKLVLRKKGKKKKC